MTANSDKNRRYSVSLCWYVNVDMAFAIMRIWMTCRAIVQSNASLMKASSG